MHTTGLLVRKRFSFCSFFFSTDPSLEVSVEDLLEATRYFRIKNLKVSLQIWCQ